MDKKKWIISGVIIVAIIAVFLTFLRRKPAEIDSKEEAVVINTESQDEDNYLQVDNYKDSKKNDRVLPISMEYYIDGKLVQKTLFDADARRYMYSKGTEIGNNPSELWRIGDDGTEYISERYSYQYNDDGKILSKRTYVSDPETQSEETMKLQSIMEAVYFSNGKIYKEIFYDADQNGNTTAQYFNVYTYDENSFPSGCNTYQDSALQEYQLFQCNSNGDIVHKEHYSYGDTLTGKTDFQYREDGQMLSYQYSDFTGDVTYEEIRDYDSKDYLRQIIQIYHDYDFNTGDPKEIKVTIVVNYADEDQSKLGQWSQTK